jgi:hypothetical protein
MKHSPFEFFRRNQRVGMVILTVMAMFAFVFLDQTFRGVGGSGGQPAQVAVKVKGGNLTYDHLARLVAQRMTANRFIEAVARAIIEDFPKDQGAQLLARNVMGQQFGRDFPGDSESQNGLETSVMWGHVMRLEAHRLGLAVNDTMVVSYITQMSAHRLSAERFQEILKASDLKEKHVYDAFREEILAKMALNVLFPRVNQTPEQYWEFFKRMKVHQNLEIAALPVSEFTKSLNEPTARELETLFNANKQRYGNDAPDYWKPGFRQPTKVRMQYLTTSYEKVEKRVEEGKDKYVKPVTEKEVVEYYESKKDPLYVEEDLSESKTGAGKKETDPLSPVVAPEKGATPEGAKPKTATPDEKPESKPTDPPASKPADKPATDKPSTDKPSTDKPAPAADKSATDTPAAKPDAKPEVKPEAKPEAKPADQPASKPADKPAEAKPADSADKKPCGDDPVATEAAAETKKEEVKSAAAGTADAKTEEAKPAADKPTADKPAAEKPADPAVKAEAAPKAETKTTTDAKPAADKPAADKPAADKPATDKPAADKPAAAKAGETPTDAAAPDAKPTQDDATKPKDGAAKGKGDAKADFKPTKFKPLTAVLKEEIREALQKERTNEAMKLLGEDAKRQLDDYQIKFSYGPSISGHDVFIDFNEDGAPNDDEPAVQSKTKLTADDVSKLPQDLLNELNAKLFEMTEAAMKQVGAGLGMEYKATGLISPRDLEADLSLSKIADIENKGFQAHDSGRIQQELFGSENKFHARVGVDPETNLYVYWKVEHIKEHIAKFTDPGIKEEVTATWKLLQAYPLAQKRAEELVKLADGKKTLNDAFKGATVLGDKDSLPLEVHETGDFSWMTGGVPSPNMMQATPPKLSHVNWADDADQEFMEAACEDIEVGKVGYAPDRDHAVVYVIRVVNREGEKGQDMAMLREKFMKEPLFESFPAGMDPMFRQFYSPPPYAQMAFAENGRLYYDWLESLRQQFQISWTDEMRNER